MSETSGVRSALRLLAVGAPARIGRCIALLLLLAVVVVSGLTVLLMAATAATLAAAAADPWPRSNVLAA